MLPENNEVSKGQLFRRSRSHISFRLPIRLGRNKVGRKVEKWPYKEEVSRGEWLFLVLFSSDAPNNTREQTVKIEGRIVRKIVRKIIEVEVRPCWRIAKEESYFFSLSVWFVVSILIEIPWRFFYLNAAPKFNEFLSLYLTLREKKYTREPTMKVLPSSNW